MSILMLLTGISISLPWKGIAKPRNGIWRWPPRCRQCASYFGDNVIHVGKLRTWTNGLERATRREYAHSFSLSMSKLAGAERTSRFTLRRMMAILR
jgi:hypothetical protein